MDITYLDEAVEHTFEKNPKICPECSSFMLKDVVFSSLADREIKKLVHPAPLLQKVVLGKDP